MFFSNSMASDLQQPTKNCTYWATLRKKNLDNSLMKNYRGIKKHWWGHFSTAQFPLGLKQNVVMISIQDFVWLNRTQTGIMKKSVLPSDHLQPNLCVAIDSDLISDIQHLTCLCGMWCDLQAAFGESRSVWDNAKFTWSCMSKVASMYESQ